VTGSITRTPRQGLLAKYNIGIPSSHLRRNATQGEVLEKLGTSLRSESRDSLDWLMGLNHASGIICYTKDLTPCSAFWSTN
jgi:hypothetical protein